MTWTYDPLMRVSHHTTTADGLNQIGLWNGNAVDYDSRGNMTLSDEVYTAENLMTWRLNTPIYYDPLGRLLLVISSPWTRFAWDGGDLVGEAETDGTQRTRYVHGGGEVLVGYDGPGLATRTFYHSDERGSIVAHTSSTGAVTAVDRYDEYGLPASGNSGRFQYTGQLYDPLMPVRHQTTSNANPRTFIFDGPNMLVQNMNGNFLLRYVYGPGRGRSAPFAERG